MKISPSQLRRMIIQETRRVLREKDETQGTGPTPEQEKDWADFLDKMKKEFGQRKFGALLSTEDKNTIIDNIDQMFADLVSPPEPGPPTIRGIGPGTNESFRRRRRRHTQF